MWCRSLVTNWCGYPFFRLLERPRFTDMKQVTQSSTLFDFRSARLLVVLGEQFLCTLPGRPRLSQFYLVVSGCLTMSLSQLYGRTGVCSWGLLVCGSAPSQGRTFGGSGRGHSAFGLSMRSLFHLCCICSLYQHCKNPLSNLELYWG